VDFEAPTVRLEPGTTKNREGRTLFLTPELLNLLDHQWAMTITLERHQRKIIPWVFHRQGAPIKNFRKPGDMPVRRQDSLDSSFMI
jgi:hypothetical protein